MTTGWLAGRRATPTAAASSRYNTAAVFGGILSLLIVVLAMDAAVTAIERAWLRWAPRDRSPFR